MNVELLFKMYFEICQEVQTEWKSSVEYVLFFEEFVNALRKVVEDLVRR